jgi:hypothetical protein
MRGRRLRPRLRRTLQVLLGLFLGLLVGEAGVRIYFAVAPPPSRVDFIPDRYAGYRNGPEPPSDFPPGHDGHINAFGFRGREHPVEKPPEAFRVLGIGDSFVYGSVPMQANFLRVAEREANLHRPPGSNRELEMILMGVPGYTPENYRGVLRSIGLRLDPDLVVLCFFVGNDVTGIPVRGQVLGGQIYYVGSANPWLNLLRKSYLYNLAEKVVLSAWERRYRPEESGAPLRISETDPLKPSPPYLLFQAKRLPVYREVPDPQTERLWKEAEGYLEEFDALCKRAGVPWILFLIPSEMQVDPAVRDRVLDALSRPAADYQFDAPQKRLRRFAEARGIPVLDPLEDLRRDEDPEDRLYLPNDTHWSVRGNRLAGEILARELIARMAPAADGDSASGPGPSPGQAP